MKKLIALLSVVLLINSCHVGRYFVYNFANINDYNKFQNRGLTASSHPFSFAEIADTTGFSKKLANTEFKSITNLEDVFQNSKTVSFLVIQNDTIKYEWYDDEYNDTSMFTSFSMAKSYISAMIGIAIDEGYIKSIDEPITNYIKTFKHDGFEKITIEHLLNMRTGIDYSETYYNPFGNIAIAYYGRHLDKHIRKLKIKKEPNQEFDYISISTQLLAVILETATGKTATEYCQEKIWEPIGMEYDASWSVDRKKGMEKAFCCLNARAKDYAKFGRLFLNNGNWNGIQVVPDNWVKQSVQLNPRTKDNFYQYQWWLLQNNTSSKIVDFMAQGILGQYTFVSPNKKTIIIRLGENWGRTNWPAVFKKINYAL